MPRDRFIEILRFISNSRACYKPQQNITVDEQLFPTKARCRFTQYMPNKPHKFGIKFWLAVDVQSKYILNGFPYMGKDETRCSNSLGQFVTLKLAEPYLQRGRNITTDNFFTSIPLAKKLLALKTTLVGTIRSNKRELPKPAKETKDKMTLFSSNLYKSEDCTLTVYKKTITFYNKTKFGVDVADQMARKYSVKAGCFRWPLQVFYNILDLAAINTWILYKECTGSKISRKEFIFCLAKELAGENKENHRQSSDVSVLSPSTSGVRKSYQVGYYNKNKSSNCFFDGYPDKGEEKHTKSAERHRRGRLNCLPEVVCDINIVSKSPQDKFLSNEKNKRNIINILSPKLRDEGFIVKQAVEDADSIQQSPSATVTNQCCDTMSSLYKQGKAKLIKLLKNDCNGLKKEANLFNDPTTLKSSIQAAGQNIIMTLYGARQKDNFCYDEFRFLCFTKSSLKSTFNLSSLPLTAEACNEHSL
ncbi:hypothetical protein KPH14_006423 [Odynerus spinipes]|uniref:PiggyBac transposable element-derived protein domain-containing protein n=1 Tax=Odynerus spinipes TaxID=1348599 RepID=A0AAD9RQE1_9HYME|nr:hypothetical protein KPH14_006423 [Odynerus spinipes]